MTVVAEQDREPEGQPIPVTHQQAILAAIGLPQPPLVPTRVAVALNFIRHCNDHMGLRAFTVASRGRVNTEIKEQDLHFKQDAAFQQACILVGNYFAGKDIK